MQQMIDFINNINDNDRSEFNYYYDHIMEKLNELLEVEKQQIEDAHIEGQRVFDKHPHTQWTNDQAEQYYNETYGSKGSVFLEGYEQINQDNPVTRGSTTLVNVTSSQTELSDKSWEGCDGCTEQDEVMYKNGYVKGYNAAISELPKEISDDRTKLHWKTSLVVHTPEISDEEIEKAVKNPMHDAYDFREGAKWYREQLKK